jgi:predicted MFS family arabinose efflux permease
MDTQRLFYWIRRRRFLLGPLVRSSRTTSRHVNGYRNYSLSTLICLFSPSIIWLLVSRIIQAFGASVGSVIVLTIIREAFQDKERLKIFSLVSIALSLTPALGPFIGGYISHWWGWRANFCFLLIMGLGLLLYSFNALPETKPLGIETKPVIKTGKLALQFMRDSQLLARIWIIGAINGILFSYYAEAPFIFIKILGLTSGQYGWLGILIAAASLLGAACSFRLNHLFSSHGIILSGFLVMFINLLFLSFFAVMGWINSAHFISSVLFIIIPMSMTIGSFGIVMPAILSSALDNYKFALGTAGALFGLSYYLLTAGLTWLMGVLHNGTVLPMPFYFLILIFLILINYCGLIASKEQCLQQPKHLKTQP